MRAVVIANKTSEGISVIGVDLYNDSGRLCERPTKRFIDGLNAVPMLDTEKIKNIVSKQFGVPKKDIIFN
jgi:hypothetical protein